VKMTEVDHKVIEILSNTLKTPEEDFQPDTEISAVEELIQNSEEIVALRSPTPEAPQNIENLRRNRKRKF
jgi:hypothetical protein